MWGICQVLCLILSNPTLNETCLLTNGPCLSENEKYHEASNGGQASRDIASAF